MSRIVAYVNLKKVTIMKIKNILMLVSIAAMTVWGLSACSDDSESSDEIFFKNVEVDKSYIEIDPNGTGEVVVEEGNGGYTARSSDENVATATIEGNTVLITGHVAGKAHVIVTDKENVEQGINVLVYSDVTLEQSSISVSAGDPTLGTTFSASMEITSGNGGYKIECENPDVDARVVDDMLIVSVNAIVTDIPAKLVDRTGRSADFTITSIDPYIEFRANGTLQTVFKGVTRPDGARYYTYFTEYVNSKFHYGWNYQYSQTNRLEVQFPGTLEVGKKTGAQIWYAISASDQTSGFVDLDMLSVIQNDGTKVWIIFRHKVGENVFDGTMVQNIVVP